jgi:hypothetical protein
MILTDFHIDRSFEKFNPSITLLENLTRQEYLFPDPNSYYILSDAGKNYRIMENSTLLLSIKRGYFESNFSISESYNLLLSFANSLFKDAYPIQGDAKKALDLAIKKCGKDKPTLKNRF